MLNKNNYLTHLYGVQLIDIESTQTKEQGTDITKSLSQFRGLYNPHGDFGYANSILQCLLNIEYKKLCNNFILPLKKKKIFIFFEPHIQLFTITITPILNIDQQ